MKGVVSISVGRKNLLEELVGVGNVGVPSSFVTSDWRARLDGEVDLCDS